MDYHGAPVSDAMAAECRAAAGQLLADVRAWLARRKYGQVLGVCPYFATSSAAASAAALRARAASASGEALLIGCSITT